VLPGTPIAAALGDQQAALFGQTCFSPARPSAPTARARSCCSTPARPRCLRPTACSAPSATRSATSHPPTHWRARSPSPARWCSGCGTGSGLIDSAPEIETLARTVDDNGGCYIVPAFSGLFAPHWRSEARGLIIGLTSYITKGHLARAILEATAWQTREVVDAMNADSGLALTGLKVDGGMTSDHLLMQTIADVLDVPVERPMVSETVSLGAAYAAGLAVGFWPELKGLQAPLAPGGEVAAGDAGPSGGSGSTELEAGRGADLRLDPGRGRPRGLRLPGPCSCRRAQASATTSGASSRACWASSSVGAALAFSSASMRLR
jgi:glycerol kinase